MRATNHNIWSLLDMIFEDLTLSYIILTDMGSESFHYFTCLVARLGKPWGRFHSPLLLSKCAARSSPHLAASEGCPASLLYLIHICFQDFPVQTPKLRLSLHCSLHIGMIILFGQSERNKRNLSYGNIITSWFQDMWSADAGWMNHSLCHLGANSKLLRWTVKKRTKRLVIANFSK